MDQIKKVAVIPVELEGELYKKEPNAKREIKKKRVNEVQEVKVIQVKPKWKIVK
jgi:hypothetical protein